MVSQAAPLNIDMFEPYGSFRQVHELGKHLEKILGRNSVWTVFLIKYIPTKEIYFITGGIVVGQPAISPQNDPLKIPECIFVALYN